MARSPGKWLTVSEVAEILKTSTETVRRKIAAGELPASRASTAARAAWMIDAEEFGRQREQEIERAAVRRRLAGVVTGRGDEFVENLEVSEHPATVKAEVRETHDRVQLIEMLAAEMDRDDELNERFKQLDDEERIEQAAQELARRVRRHERRDERIRARALAILEEEDDA